VAPIYNQVNPVADEFVDQEGFAGGRLVVGGRDAGVEQRMAERRDEETA